MVWPLVTGRPGIQLSPLGTKIQCPMTCHVRRHVVPSAYAWHVHQDGPSHERPKIPSSCPPQVWEFIGPFLVTSHSSFCPCTLTCLSCDDVEEAVFCGQWRAAVFCQCWPSSAAPGLEPLQPLKVASFIAQCCGKVDSYTVWWCGKVDSYPVWRCWKVDSYPSAVWEGGLDSMSATMIPTPGTCRHCMTVQASATLAKVKVSSLLSVELLPACTRNSVFLQPMPTILSQSQGLPYWRSHF